MGPARLSIFPSVLYGLVTRKKRRKIRIGVNVLQGRSNRCTSFQLKRSKARVSVRAKVAQLCADGRIICRYWAVCIGAFTSQRLDPVSLDSAGCPSAASDLCDDDIVVCVWTSNKPRSAGQRQWLGVVSCSACLVASCQVTEPQLRLSARYEHFDIVIVVNLLSTKWQINVFNTIMNLLKQTLAYIRGSRGAPNQPK